MSDFPNDTASKDNPQSLDELRPIGSAFGAGPEVYEDTAEEAAEDFFRRDYRSALRAYSRLLLLDGSRTEGWIGYILSLLFQGEIDQASIWARNAERSLPDNPTILAIRVLVQLIRKTEPVSPERISRLKSSESDDPLFWIMRGWFALEHVKSEKLEYFHRAEDLAGPGNWQIPMLVGSILERYGRTGGANHFYKRAKGAFHSKFGGKTPVADIEPKENYGAGERGSEKGLGALVQRWLRRRKN